MKAETKQELKNAIKGWAPVLRSGLNGHHARDILATIKELRSKLRDREARLQAMALVGVDSRYGDGGEYTRSKAFGKAVRRITDLKNENWRK